MGTKLDAYIARPVSRPRPVLSSLFLSLSVLAVLVSVLSHPRSSFTPLELSNCPTNKHTPKRKKKQPSPHATPKSEALQMRAVPSTAEHGGRAGGAYTAGAQVGAG